MQIFFLSSNNGVLIFNYYASLMAALYTYFGGTAGKTDLYEDNIYVADPNNNRVAIINTYGIFATYSTYPSHGSLAHCEYVSSEKVPSSNIASSITTSHKTSHMSLSNRNISMYSILNLFINLLIILMLL